MKNAFVDSTGLLLAWGFTDTNGPNDTKVPVADDFVSFPGTVQWNGTDWVPHTSAEGAVLTTAQLLALQPQPPVVTIPFVHIETDNEGTAERTKLVNLDPTEVAPDAPASQ